MSLSISHFCGIFWGCFCSSLNTFVLNIQRNLCVVFFNHFCFFLTLSIYVNLSAVRSSMGPLKHFKIHERDGSDFHVEPNHQFSSLIDLVEHYCTNSLNNTGTLGNPCKRVGPTVLAAFLLVPLISGHVKTRSVHREFTLIQLLL